MNHVAARAYQVAMAAGKNFLSWKWPAFIAGDGALNQLPDNIKSHGFTKVMIVTGHTVAKQKFMKNFIALMDEKNIEYVWFSEVKPNPTIENVEEVRRLYVENGCGAFVAVGGGSSMDCAKIAAARVANPNKSVAQLRGLLKLKKRIPPMYAVPTTAGSGSETTIAALVTDETTHQKYTVNDVKMLPAYAILDPQVLIGLPPRVTAETGLDALTHAVEAYTNKYTTAEVRKNAKEAVRLIMGNLEKACSDGENAEYRQAMQMGAYLAGTAFTKVGVGYVHAIGHTLGGLYDVPHGRAMAVILPKVLRRYGNSIAEKLSELAEVSGVGTNSVRASAEAFILKIEELNEKLGIPTGFECIQNKDIPQMSKWAVREANPVYPCPQIWNREDIEAIIKSIRI